MAPPGSSLWSFNHNAGVAERACRRRNPYGWRLPRLLDGMVEDALRETSGGTLVAVDVRPGAAETRISGYNPWRRSLTVDLAAAPERGAANRELEALLARIGGTGCDARVVRGAAGRRKTVLVRGVSRAAMAAAIARESR